MVRFSTGEEFWDPKRNHTPIGIYNSVGRSLTRFSSTRELVLAMRSAIRGRC